MLKYGKFMGSTTVKFGGEHKGSVSAVMPSFISQTPVSNPTATEGNTFHSSRLSDFGALEQYIGYRIGETANVNRSPFSNADGTAAAINFQNVAHNMATSPTMHGDIQFFQPVPSRKVTEQNANPLSGVHNENWAVSKLADSSSRTDTSTDMDAEDRSQRVESSQGAAVGAHDSSNKSKEKNLDQKTLRRLAQNREAARKSRLRKKAYVQQLENSRLKLTQMEQELQRARGQGVYIANMADPSHTISGNGAMTFDVEYSRWLEEHKRHINELRAAVNSHASDTELRMVVDNVTNHYNDIFRLKGVASKADAFHILSGMWKTPAERCFMWIGGFRPCELLKLLVTHLEPLTEQQSASIYQLQQSSQQAEEALSQGMEALQQSLAETLANGSSGPEVSSGNVANYMGQMAMAMGKLGTLEGFVRQADNLRQQTLQQLHRILTTRQSARALLTIHDYFSRLRALSSLWLARPQE